ncbi:MAG: hypothetical protein WA655_03905 [Candidatus Korobacteraceae bacterium]
MVRRGKIILLLPVAVLVLALGCSSEKARKALLAHPKVRIAMDGSSSPPSCYAAIGWVSLPAGGTIDWTAGADDSNTYEVQFPTTTYPLTDSSGNAVASPITVNSSGTQSGTNKGPFSVSSSANYSCKAGAGAASCYLTYDIKSNGQSCVQHYGGGFGVYTTGIHLER